ncbi:hypothetical protein [Methanobrevibacter arboriphilus]|uniref:hypothetical protein n=1 Tax=Methanobrevibacter arboriphilus TaxID=39441 RepID=UPI0006D2AD11|nr:hypothetical protein [Methanobrevibacter arboriphilus]
MTYDTKNPYPREGEGGAYIEYTGSSMLLASMFEVIGAVNIPRNYQNGAFNDSEISQKAKFMNISLINLTGENDGGDSIILNSGDSFTLDCIIYLALYNNLKIFRIDSSNNDFSIGIYDANDIKIKDIQNNEDLKNYNINNTEFKVKITANTSTIINNIHFEIVTKTPDNDSKVKIFLDQIEGVAQWEDELIEKVLETEELEDINEIPRTAKIGDVFFNKEGTELSLSAQQLLNVIKTVDGINSGLDSEYLGGQKYDKYASRIRRVTKKYSELANGDYIVGYNHLGAISGKFVTINLESGDWINLDGYDFSHSENFGGVFNSSYVESSMSTSEIDSCFTFEVQRQTPQDLIDVKTELLSKIGDNITVEKYDNGIRYKKDGVYIYSACWGLVNLTTTGSNGTASTTVNFPFTFHNVGGTLTSVIAQSPLYQNCGNGNNQVSSVDIYAQRTTAGTSGVRWCVYGR